MWSRNRRSIRLSRYWNARIAGQPLPELTTLAAPLDPTIVEAIDRLVELDDARLPSERFVERLERDLMRAIAVNQRNLALLHPPLAVPGNGRYGVPTRRPQMPSLPSRARRWAAAQLATALMLILVLLGSFYVFYDNRPAALPTVETSPTAVPATPDATPAEGWPMWGGNPARTRHVPGPGPVNQPVVRWTYPATGSQNDFANIDRGAVADGVLYMPTETGAIVAVEAATGRELWRAEGYGNAVVLDGDGLIVHGNPLGAATDLARISRADGSLVWTGEQGHVDPAWNPVIADGVGYVPSGSDLIAFDPATGEVLWRMPLDATASRGASVADGLAVLGGQQGTVYGVSTAGGDMVWTYPTDATTIGHPTLANGAVYVNGIGGAEEAYYAIDAATGALLWRFVAPGGVGFLTAATDGTTLYLPARDGDLYALDTATGALRWRFEADAEALNSPALAGDTLYVCSWAGVVFALDPTTGAERWRIALDRGCASAAVVADGVYYVTSDAGTTYAIGGAGSAVSIPAAAATPTTSSTESVARGGSATAQIVWSASGYATDRLDNPVAARLSPDGTLWVSDISSRFFIFDLDGNLQEVWGAPGGDPGQFSFGGLNGENGNVAFAADGTFYVVDTFNFRIQHFASDRTYLGEWGGRGIGNGQFLLPVFMAIAPDGSLLVTDYGRNDVQRFDPTGTFLGAFDGSTGPEGKLVGPVGIAIDAAGRVYLVETDANRVRVFDLQGNQLGILGAKGPDFGGLNYPIDIAVDENGYIYVTDTYNNRIVVFDPAGRFVFQWGEKGRGDGQFSDPGSIALNRGGTVYVADWHGDRVVKFKITGPFPPPAEATPAP